VVEARALVTTAREAILQSVAASAGESAAILREYRREGRLAPAERVALFCERAGEYRAEVRRVAGSEVARAAEEVCRAHGVRRLGIPAGLAPEWRPVGVEPVEDTGLSPRELDALDGVLTGSTLAIAETGTIALTAGPGEGRRALTLVPDLHVCVVEESRIVELVPEAMGRLGELVARERRPVTLVSGPSATSDIELSRVEGVHGPRTLVVLVVAERPLR
jgi:L-lactate dehydrogenase complex protein LldG